MKQIAYAGSYNETAGLRIFEVDDATGAFAERGVVAASPDPIYMTPSKNGAFLYVAQRVNGRGGVAVYRTDSGTLTKVAEYEAADTVPCHIALSPDGTKLGFAEYRNGTAGYFDVTDDGRLSGPAASVKHAMEGAGANKERQDAPHCHCAVFSPDNKRLCICDLGMDKVFAYNITPEGLVEDESAGFTALPGDGPRHLVFHPNDRFAYLVNELAGTVTALEYSDAEGFTEIDTYRTLPQDFHFFSKAAAIKISPDGNFVLASNRGHDSIAVFRINAETGALERKNICRLSGEFPRDFEFVPGGKFILLGHKMSDEVAMYTFDAHSGSIKICGEVHAMPKPLCFVFKPNFELPGEL